MNKSHSADSKKAYREQCALVDRLRNDAKREFVCSRVIECGRDQKRLTKGLLGWVKDTSTPSNIPDSALPTVFSDFFIDKIIKIRNDISYQDMTSIFTDIRRNIISDPPPHSASTLNEFIPASME